MQPPRFTNDAHPASLAEREGQWPSLAEIARTFETLAAASEGKLSVRTLGHSVEGRPILAAFLTDPKFPIDDKQVALMIAAEHGGERSATGTLLELVHWLLSPEGAETLRQQLVVLIPAVNADGYDTDGRLVNRNGVNLFADYHYDGSAPSQPESTAVWKLMEELQPDLFASLHGMSHDYERMGYPRTWESTDVAYTSQYEHCYNRRVVERANAAAEAEGFMMDRGEEDLERLLPRLPGYEYHSLPTFEHFAGCVSYCYNRFHSLGMVMEIGPVRSGFLRCRELLRIGNERWEYECYPGYPNRRITSACIGRCLLTAGGKTAAQRRKSRTLLWQHSRNILMGMNATLDATRAVAVITKMDDGWATQFSFANMGALVADYESRGVPIAASCEQIGDLWKIPPLVWNDAWMVSRFRERREGAAFPQYRYDPSLKTGELSVSAAFQLRLDREVTPTRVRLNDRLLQPGQYRFWSDRRYGYLEADLPEGWQRGIIAVETTSRLRQGRTQ